MFTIDTVAARLRLRPSDPEYAELEDIVDAVRALVSTWLAEPNPEHWEDSCQLGAVMLAARLHRRRNSPAGVEQFNELGQMYVSRWDPDVAMLLGLGGWTRPRVG